MADFFDMREDVFGKPVIGVSPADEKSHEAAQKKPLHIATDDTRTGLDTATDDVPELEDVELKAHMQLCREQLAKHIRSAPATMSSVEIRTTLVELTGQITATLLKLDPAISEQGTQSDEIHILSRHINTLHQHGKATAPTFDENMPLGNAIACRTLERITKVLDPTAKRMEEFNKGTLKEFKSAFTKMRHQINALAEGCVRTLEAHENIIARQRELLAAARQVYDRDRIESERVRGEVFRRER